MDQPIRDWRHAWRAIVRRPSLATVVVLSLGAGIGVNTTVFSFVQSHTLRPLPGVDDPGSSQLVEAWAEPGSYPGTSRLEYRDLQERRRAFAELFAFRIQALTVGDAGQAERMPAAIGVYALVAYTVSNRTAEIGVRLALA